MGSAFSSKNKWAIKTRGSLEFGVSDNQIIISNNKRTASWQACQFHIHGQCYTNRAVKVNEKVTLTANGSGFVDIGMTDTHPVQMMNTKNTVFKFLVARVLHFEPYVVTIRVLPTGSVMAAEGTESGEKHVADLGAKPKSHWLVVKMGCGDLSVTISKPSNVSKDSNKDKKPTATTVKQAAKNTVKEREEKQIVLSSYNEQNVEHGHDYQQ